MKILVLGSNGQLGRCLADQFWNTNSVLIFATRDNFDVTDYALARNKITQIKPDLIINASAYTAVDQAEYDHEQAYLVNQHSVANIADICADIDCGLIHVSTDYVFDGKTNRPYVETDITNPQGVYGDSKLRGEQAVQLSGCRYIILRTSWVFSEYGNNFLKTMLRLGAEKDELRIVNDQFGCPTYAQDLANGIVTLASCFSDQSFSSSILHYCGDRPCTWYEFASTIFAYAETRGLRIPLKLVPITTDEYPTPAFRPLYSVLKCSSTGVGKNLIASNWKSSIARALHNME